MLVEPLKPDLGLTDSHLALLGGVAFSIFYLCPPSRSITKLFNFSLIKSWKGGYQRLHGGEIVFKEGFDKSMECGLYKEYAWDKSPFKEKRVVFLHKKYTKYRWRSFYPPPFDPSDSAELVAGHQGREMNRPAR